MGFMSFVVVCVWGTRKGMIPLLHIEWQTLTLPDGSPPMEAYLAKPAQGKGSWPAVIVLMEIFGVNAHIRSVTERIAAEGYVAFAINFYHRSTPNLELAYSEAGMKEGLQHKGQTTKTGILADVRAAIGYLKSRPDVDPKDKMGTIGFCFGGHVGYIAATLPDIAATASFYGGGVAVSCPGESGATVELTPQIKGEMLCLFGADDHGIPPEQVDKIEAALNAAGTRYTVSRYPGAGHGFFRDGSESYNESAAADAWEKVKNLYKRTLK